MLGFLGDALKVIAKVAGIGSVDDAVATVKATIAGNDELQSQLRELDLKEKRLFLEETKSIHGLYQTEIKSEDAFVRRARPALLWLVFSILSMQYVVLPLINTVVGIWGVEPTELIIPELPATVAGVITTIVSVYIGARSFDKKTKAKGR